MSHRPLVLVSGLAVGDYLLWNWSLNANQDVLALVSGLTLPPLAVAVLWLAVLSIARLIAAVTRVAAVRADRRRARASALAARRGPALDGSPAAEGRDSTPGGAPPRKLAA